MVRRFSKSNKSNKKKGGHVKRQKMSVREKSSTVQSAMDVIDAASNVASDSLAEGNSYCVANPDNPLKRTLVVSIKASLNDMCLQKSRGVWSPSQEALRSIFQQRRFTTLDGAAEQMGDLKSVVLHKLTVQHVKSTFPMSLGARVTGVDDSTFSSTGESYSTIMLPNCESTREMLLQADEVALAYDFAKKFPGYTASNLCEKGVHEVAQRRFVLVANDHPLVSALSDNVDKLQMGEIS